MIHGETSALELGVNIDHVATVRNARGTRYPDPVLAATLAEQAGADLITLHLREDRRHIRDEDVTAVRRAIRTRMNLESAVTDEMLAIAVAVRPDDVCLVPERREEVTTEGGLDVAGQRVQVRHACETLHQAGIRVSLFIDPDERQIAAAADVGARVIEIHTGRYAEASAGDTALELERVSRAVDFAASLGMRVNAGHGLNYDNVAPVAALWQIAELNIGHAIVAQAVFDGWVNAIARMKALMVAARRPVKP